MFDKQQQPETWVIVENDFPKLPDNFGNKNEASVWYSQFCDSMNRRVAQLVKEIEALKKTLKSMDTLNEG